MSQFQLKALPSFSQEVKKDPKYPAEVWHLSSISFSGREKCVLLFLPTEINRGVVYFFKKSATFKILMWCEKDILFCLCAGVIGPLPPSFETSSSKVPPPPTEGNNTRIIWAIKLS